MTAIRPFGLVRGLVIVGALAAFPFVFNEHWLVNIGVFTLMYAALATAAAGGVVFGITNSFNPGSHYDLISRLLTIIVLGGLGSLRGAIIAALVMLVTEDITAVLISPVWATFVFFVILVAVLIVRPQGLFGVRVRERI